MTSLTAAALGIALVLGVAQAARAAEADDCPPAGRMPTYVADGKSERFAYEMFEFSVKAGDDTKTVPVTGQTCRQAYTPKEGTDPLSDLEIQTNYREQLKAGGFDIVFADDVNTVARKPGDKGIWVHIASQSNRIDVRTALPTAHRQTLTAPAAKDWKRLGHMPGYEADPPEKRNFDKYEFQVREGDDSRTVVVTGEKYLAAYSPTPATPLASDLDIQTNYRNALTALGAEILFTDYGRTTARLVEDGRTAWVTVSSQSNRIDIAVIEEKPLQLSIQPPRADAMKTALEKAGRITLYINFDFAKATIRPESQPVIQQIVALLKADPTLKVAIEGHTDDIGTRDYNMTLSQARANAVMAAVAAAGIEASRLTAAGFGPDKPIANNSDPDGRARNRRVELVKG